jgi:hypothetical protein
MDVVNRYFDDAHRVARTGSVCKHVMDAAARTDGMGVTHTVPNHNLYISSGLVRPASWPLVWELMNDNPNMQSAAEKWGQVVRSADPYCVAAPPSVTFFTENDIPTYLVSKLCPRPGKSVTGGVIKRAVALFVSGLFDASWQLLYGDHQESMIYQRFPITSFPNDVAGEQLANYPQPTSYSMVEHELIREPKFGQTGDKISTITIKDSEYRVQVHGDGTVFLDDDDGNDNVYSFPAPSGVTNPLWLPDFANGLCGSAVATGNPQKETVQLVVNQYGSKKLPVSQVRAAASKWFTHAPPVKPKPGLPGR